MNTNPDETHTNSDSAKPLLVATITAFLWGSAFVAIRPITDSFSPAGLALGRLLVATFALGVALLIVRARRPAGHRQLSARAQSAGWLHWLAVGAHGVIWFGGYTCAINAAEETLNAGTTALLVSLAPILIALGSGLILGEGFPPLLFVGMGVAIAGVGLVAFADEQRLDRTGMWLALLAAICYAIGVLAQKVALRRIEPLKATFFGCLIGAAACLPGLLNLIEASAAAPAKHWLLLVYLGALPTAVAFWTWAYALSRLTAGTTSVFTYAVPVVSVLLSALLLAETPAPAALVGGAVCLGGVYLTRRR